MLLLAYRKQPDPMASLLNNGALVPVSLSYEIDPCGPAKAGELAAIDRVGHYAKGEQEDLNSMIQGLVGEKGRVHVHFNGPIGDDCNNVEDLVQRLDRAIVGGIRVFSTNRYADSVLAGRVSENSAGSKAVNILQSQLSNCADSERTFLLQQYANICVNRRELGLDG